MEINEYIKLFENIQKNNNRIFQIESIIQYRKLYDNMDCEKYISEMNQLLKLNNEIYADIKNFNLKDNNGFNIEKYVESIKSLDSDDDRIKELDELISMRNVLGRDTSAYREEYNKIISHKNQLSEQLKSYNIEISKDKADIIYDRYLLKQKIFTIGQKISSNNSVNSKNFIDSFEELKTEINNFHTVDDKLNKINNEERLAYSSEKLHFSRRLEEIKQLIKENNIKLGSLTTNELEYSKCKRNIDYLEKELDAVLNNLEKTELKEKNYYTVQNLTKPLENSLEEQKISEKQDSLYDSKNEREINQTEIKEIISGEEYFRDYKINGERLDNLEKYGVSYSTKSLKCINSQPANKILLERVKNIPKLFDKFRGKVENFVSNVSTYMEQNIELGRVK